MHARRQAAPTLREWLREGPFALGMSSGFFGFFAHCGFLCALEDEGLLPARLSGSSAGALVAGMWAAGMSAAALGREILELKREHFWDPGPGLGLLRGRSFRKRLQALLPVSNFADCRAPLAVSAYDVLRRRTVVLDRGDLAAALHASCALPVMFQPVWIGGRPFMDGGIADRPGLAGLEPGARVLFHHLASRSPWRRPDSPSLEIPARHNMVTVAIDGLPRVQPFALERGRPAFESARAAAQRALARPANAVVIRA